MADIERDDTLDLTALITNEKPNEAEETEKILSPAEKILKEREQGIGTVVSNQDLKDGEEKALRNPVDNDERLDDYDARLNELNYSTLVRTYLTVKHKPVDELENMEMMHELTTMKVEDLQALQKRYPNGAPLKSMYFDLAPANTDADHSAEVQDPTSSKIVEISAAAGEEDDVDSGSELLATPEQVSKFAATQSENQEIVRILIDKTNLGIPPELSEVEKSKILNASQVDVIEVENLDLSTMTIVKAPKSFVETIGMYEYQGVQIPMTFPCSRFRATMMGLSYGEMADIAMAYDNSTYETERKKLTVIYNKMKNISSGPFASFDDFLDGFAFTDVDLAVYGLYLASCQEKDWMTLKCGKTGCERGFNAPFVARSLLDLDRCSSVFLKVMQQLVDVEGSNAKVLRGTSPIFNHKMIKLPSTGWVVKIGMMTCRDWLEGVMRQGDLEEFKKTHPEDVNNILYQNILFLQTVRAIYIPNGKGGYFEYTDYNDILEALYVLNPDDVQMLGSIMSKYTEDYSVYFSVKDVTCPHCKTHTNSVSVSIDNMVFRAYQRRINTTVNLEKLQDF